MHPHPSPMLLATGAARFVGGATRTDAGAIPLPAGVRAGDMAVVVTSSGSTASGWTLESQSVLSLYWRLLTQGDIDTPPTLSGSPVATLVYRGPKTLAKRAAATGGLSDTLSLTGFEKAAAKALVTAIRVPAGTGGTRPTGFADRVSGLNDGSSGLYVADLMIPATYENGDPLVWSGLGGPPSVHGMVVELI